MKTVFRFTFMQQIKSKSYIITTVVIAALLFALSLLGLIIAGKNMDSDKDSDLTFVYVCDSSSLAGMDYNLLHLSENKHYKDVVFKNFDGTIEEAAHKAGEESDHAVACEIKNKENKFEILIVKPENFAADNKSAERIGNYMCNNLRYVMYEKSGISDEQKTELMRKTSVEMSVIGEDGASEDQEMLKNFLPAVFGIVLYMMLCIYGQNVARSVVLEKDSKMMETLLVMTKPYSLIFGKILGIYFAAILQLVVWIASLGAGLGMGISSVDSIADMINELLASFIQKGGFSPAASAIALLTLLVGFLLFVALSALVGTFASKSEEVQAYYGIFTIVIVVSWMFPYINSLNGNEHIMNILRYIPFTAPFTTPGDILLGNMNIIQSIISTVIVLAASVVIVFLAAKVYKAMVLYRGAPPKPKDIIKIIKKES